MTNNYNHKILLDNELMRSSTLMINNMLIHTHHIHNENKVIIEIPENILSSLPGNINEIIRIYT